MRISDWFLVAPILAIVLCGAADEYRWSRFKTAHHCTNAGQEWRAGHPDWTVDYKGNLVPTYSSNPSRWLYFCDNDKLIWRNN